MRGGGAQPQLGEHRGGRLAAHDEALSTQVHPRPADSPGGDEPAGVAARLNEQRPQPGAHQVPGGRQPRDPTADDERVPPLVRPLGGDRTRRPGSGPRSAWVSRASLAVQISLVARSVQGAPVIWPALTFQVCRTCRA